MKFLAQIFLLTVTLLFGQMLLVSFAPSGGSNSEFPPDSLQFDVTTDNSGSGLPIESRTPKEHIPSDFGLNQVGTQLVQQPPQEMPDTLQQAELLLNGYFYDQAMPLLNELDRNRPGDPRIHELQAQCTAGIAGLVPYTGKVEHIFFHSLVVDPGKAFDGDKMSNGYNWWMATVDEFKKMLVQMHERGYMLIDIHELWETVTDNSGKPVFRKKFPLLPKGKKPFILSVDDINYYPFMEGDGFADRLVLDARGNVAARYWVQGTAALGDYDVVPILDAFVREHPDFSYRGAKGILALTGYMGTLGYRTQELDSPDYAGRANQARLVIEQLKRTGWLFASHGYGHLHSAHISLDRLQHDTARWKEEVGSLIGGTEIYIFPFGEEIPYQGDKLKYLQEQGFKVFCSVGSQTFLHVARDYVRQARCNVDGYSMLNRPKRMEDFFNVEEVVDHTRPKLR